MLGKWKSYSVFTGVPLPFHLQAANSIFVFMKTVKAKLILHPYKNENSAGHADGQPGHVDERIDFMTQNVADGYFEVVGYHNSKFNGQVSKRPGELWALFYNL